MVSWLNRPKPFEPLQQVFGDLDEFGNQTFVDFADSLVLDLVAALMAKRQQPPLPVAQSERVRKDLKYKVAVLGAVAWRRSAASEKACAAL